MRFLLIIMFIASFIKVEEVKANENVNFYKGFEDRKKRKTEIKAFILANKNTRVEEVLPEVKAKIDSIFKDEKYLLSLISVLNEERVNISEFRMMLLKRVYLHTKEIAIKWDDSNSVIFVRNIELLLATENKELTKNIMSYFERVPNPSFDLNKPGWDYFKNLNGFKGAFATALLKTNTELIYESMLNYYNRTKDVKTKTIIIAALSHKVENYTPIRAYQWLVKLEPLTKNTILLARIESAKRYQVLLAIASIITYKSDHLPKERRENLLKFILREDVRKYLPKKLLKKI